MIEKILDNHIHLYTAMLIYGIIMINKEKGDVAMSFDIQISNSANGNIAKVTETSSKIRNKGKSLLELPDSYIVIDIETTGYLPYIDDIIEVGAIKVIHDKVTETYSSLVYNDHIDPFITELTGITTEMTRNAPKLSVVLQELLDFIGDSILIAHNANFDVNFIYDAVEKELNKEFHNDFIDTLRISRKVFPDFRTHRLNYLANILELSKHPAHRSLADCYN